MIATAAAFLWLAPGISAQPMSGGPPPPVPVPGSSDFSVLMPFRGGYVNVPLSPSGVPLVPDSGASGVPAPPAPPRPPAPVSPPAFPPGVSARDGFDDGYRVIAPRAGGRQPPPASGSGYFVVPGP